MSYGPKFILRFNYFRNKAIRYCLAPMEFRLSILLAPFKIWYKNGYIGIKSDFRL